jgi:hypothetical protein
VTERLVRVGVVVCICIAAVFGVVYLVRAVDRLDDTARTNAAENFDDREFGGGNSLAADKPALYEARALIPESGRYRVIAGPHDVEGSTELTLPYIDQFARSFLMPRRPAADADWILCYGCDHAELDPSLQTVWDGGNGISILKKPG